MVFLALPLAHLVTAECSEGKVKLTCPLHESGAVHWKSYTITGSLAWFLPNSLAQEGLTGYGRSMVQCLEGREVGVRPILLLAPPQIQRSESNVSLRKCLYVVLSLSLKSK